MKEKDELIVRLLEEGKTNKEILKEAHVSCSRVTKIRKRLEGDASEPSGDIRNEAYKMYLSGKRPIDVAIELKLNNVEATRYWNEYLQLTREYELLKIRNELQDKFSSFINLYREMKKKHYRLDELKKAVQIVDKIETQSLYLFGLEADNRRCQAEIKQLEDEITKLNNDKSVAKRELDSMEGARGLLIIMVQSLMQEKVYLEKQLTQSYSGKPLFEVVKKLK
jgi:hypothetical protein